MGRLMDIYVSQMVSYLAKEGQRIAMDALFTKQTDNDTMNQQDAYGYGVFYNGLLKKKGYAVTAELSRGKHRGWDKIGVPAGTGREWLDEFFAEWKPESKGFVLIVVNAAFYSGILEQGRQNASGKKFQIISQIASEMKDLQGKFKGSALSGKNIYIK